MVKRQYETTKRGARSSWAPFLLRLTLVSLLAPHWHCTISNSRPQRSQLTACYSETPKTASHGAYKIISREVAALSSYLTWRCFPAVRCCWYVMFHCGETNNQRTDAGESDAFTCDWLLDVASEWRGNLGKVPILFLGSLDGYFYPREWTQLKKKKSQPLGTSTVDYSLNMLLFLFKSYNSQAVALMTHWFIIL